MIKSTGNQIENIQSFDFVIDNRSHVKKLIFVPVENETCGHYSMEQVKTQRTQLIVLLNTVIKFCLNVKQTNLINENFIFKCSLL